jgi:hypothetical protein
MSLWYGRSRTRTCDIYDVNVALYQLSYATLTSLEARARTRTSCHPYPYGDSNPGLRRERAIS